MSSYPYFPNAGVIYMGGPARVTAAIDAVMRDRFDMTCEEKFPIREAILLSAVANFDTDIEDTPGAAATAIRYIISILSEAADRLYDPASPKPATLAEVTP